VQINCIEQGNLYAAISLCNEIIDSASECDEAWLMLGSLYGETGEIEKTVTRVEKAIQINLGNSYAHIVLTHIRNTIGDVEVALSSFTKATEYDPGSIEAFCSFACFYQQQGEISKAIPLYEKAVKIDDSLVEVWGVLGPLHFHNRDSEAAEKCFNKAISFESNAPTLLLDWCSFLAHTFRSEQALEVLKKFPAEEKSNAEVPPQLAVASLK
jgi:Tfp pilus assembly protein PilF